MASRVNLKKLAIGRSFFVFCCEAHFLHRQKQNNLMPSVSGTCKVCRKLPDKSKMPYLEWSFGDEKNVSMSRVIQSIPPPSALCERSLIM
jgi:hypothetical protein